MRRIFIDANIYLRFYLLDQPLFQKVLPAVAGMEDEVFTTTQIADEVRRNKINAFLVHAGNFFAQIPKSLNLPSFEAGTSQKAKDWRKKMSTLKADIEDRAREYKESMKATAHSIADSKDPVSVQIEKFFRKASAPSQDQVNRARLRKELGNPPGKRSDPLGDQISWEQFLDQCQKGESAWIITRDGDFFDTVLDEIRLKPTLERDLRKKIGPNGKIYIFDDLLAGLESFKTHSGSTVKNLPSKDEIKKIYKEQNENLAANNQIFVDSPIFTPPLPNTTPLSVSSLPMIETALNSNFFTPTTPRGILEALALANNNATPNSFFTMPRSASTIASHHLVSGTGWICQNCNTQNTSGLLGTSICSNCFSSRT